MRFNAKGSTFCNRKPSFNQDVSRAASDSVSYKRSEVAQGMRVATPWKEELTHDLMK